MAKRVNVSTNVMIKRLENGRCSQCGIRTYKKGGGLVDDVEGRVLQGRCLLCCPISASPSSENVSEELMAKRIDLGRCETCEIVLCIGEQAINNDNTLDERCLRCNPLDETNPPCSHAESVDQSRGGPPDNQRGNELVSTGSSSHQDLFSVHPRARGEAKSPSTEKRKRKVRRRKAPNPATNNRQSKKAKLGSMARNENGQISGAVAEHDDGSATVVTSNVRRGNVMGSDDGDSSTESKDIGEEYQHASESVPSSGKDMHPLRSPAKDARASDSSKAQVHRRESPKRMPKSPLKKTKTPGGEGATLPAIEDAKREPENALLQERACELVKSHVSKQNADSLIETGVLEMIVAAISNHKSNKKVTLECMFALERLAWVNPKKYATEIAERNGLQAIVDMLKVDFRDVRDTKLVAAKSLKALNHVIATEVAVEKFVQSGGAEVVINKMRHYADTPSIHSSACKIIQDVVNQNGDHAPALVKAGVFGAITAGISDRDKGVSEDALGALQNLLLTNESRLQFVKEKGLEVLMPYVWTKRMKNVKKMEAAAETFFRLVSIGENPEPEFVEGILVKTIEEHNGIEAVLSSIEKHSGTASLQTIGFQSLCEMIFDHESASRAIDAHCLRAVVDGMQQHKHCDEVQELGCRILLALFEWLDVCSNREVEVIIRAMETHPGKEVVQANACAALLEAYAKSPSIRLSVNNDRLHRVLERAAFKFSQACADDVSKLIECSKGTTIKQEQEKVSL